MKQTRLFATLFAALCTSLPAAASPLTHAWSQRFGDANAQRPSAVATDAAGDIYVAGYFYGSVDFGSGVLTSAGGADVFLAKFDASGACLWSKRFGDTADQSGASVATDAAGNVYI
jgi:Beta-propeller repeat